MLVINDDNWQEHVAQSDLRGRGYERRDRASWPVASAPRSRAFDLPIIPRSEWDDRINELEKNKSTLRHVLDRDAIPSLNQGNTNYCWCNGVVTGMTAVRAANRQPYIALSPASVAAPIKNYRNYGGWGGEALEYIIDNGICSTKHWPANAIDRDYDNAQSQANRRLHMVTEWIDIDCDDRDCFDMVFTCLLLNMPVACGFNWWSHETCALWPVRLSAGRYAIGHRNSWGDDYGENGFFVLEGRKAIPDDACVPVVVTGARE